MNEVSSIPLRTRLAQEREERKQTKNIIFDMCMFFAFGFFMLVFAGIY